MKDPSKRITISDAMQHKWFNKQIQPDTDAEEAVESEVIQKLRDFKSKTQVKRTAMKLLVRMRSSSNAEI